MIFQQLCNRVATRERIDEDIIVDETSVPDDIKGRTHALCNIMQTKMEILDCIEIPFIDNAFADMDNAELLIQGYNHGDIPDYLLKEFSTKLYHQEMKDLNDDQQSVIKVLSAYIIIAHQDFKNKSI